MAIKRGAPHKYEAHNDVTDFYMLTTAEPGGVAFIQTAGSGVAPDAGQNIAVYPASPSGLRPLGMLMSKVVDIDMTRFHLNPYDPYEVNVGSKVHIHREITVPTNMIYPGQTPTAGQSAYAGPSGLVSTTYVNSVATPLVGYFQSTKDQDGYATIAFRL